MGISVATLERWRADALSMPARERAWTAAAQLQAVITTAAMDEAQLSAWCREQGVSATAGEQWKAPVKAALAEYLEERVIELLASDNKKVITDLERDWRCKEE